MLKEAAGSLAAAELKQANHEEPGGTGGAGGAGNGKGPAAAPKPRAPRAPTEMEKEQALADTAKSIHERATALQHHDPTPPDYLTKVVRVNCVDPAFSVFYSTIFTMFCCRGRPQAGLETTIHSILSSVDKAKKEEFRYFIKRLHGRVPPRPKPEAKVPDETSANFDKLLNKLASANIAAKIQQKDATDILLGIEEFVLGAVTVVRKHGAELQKKMNIQAYDYRATAAFHLFHSSKLLVELPDTTPCSRMVKYLGDAP